MLYYITLLLKSTAGFAREELVLAVAVGGTLTTFGVAGAINMGWMGGGSLSGTRIAEALDDIEAANLKFYQRYGVWPDEVSDGTPAGNVAILATKRADVNGILKNRSFRALIDADIDMGETITVRYRPLGGAVIGQTVLGDGAAYRYVVGMDNLTLEQARTFDERIDGEFNPAKGRVQISYSADGKTANVRYYVNPRSLDLATVL